MPQDWRAHHGQGRQGLKAARLPREALQLISHERLRLQTSIGQHEEGGQASVVHAKVYSCLQLELLPSHEPAAHATRIVHTHTNSHIRVSVAHDPVMQGGRGCCARMCDAGFQARRGCVRRALRRRVRRSGKLRHAAGRARSPVCWLSQACAPRHARVRVLFMTRLTSPAPQPWLPTSQPRFLTVPA